MSLRFKLILAVLALCLVGAPSMWGTPIIQSCTISVGPIDGYPQSCTFSAFNTSLGTLNSVTLQLTGVSGTVFPEQSNSSTTQTFTFTSSVTTIFMQMAGPDSFLVEVTQGSASCGGSVGPRSTNECSATSFSSLSTTALSDPNLSAYESGPVVVTASGGTQDSSGTGSTGSSGKLFFGGDGTIGGTLTLIYNYTPPPPRIPEPATLLLMGGSLTVFGMMFRKRFPRIPVR